MSKEVIVIEGYGVHVAVRVAAVDSTYHRAVVALYKGSDVERWAGPRRAHRRHALRDAELMLDALRQMADDYVAPAPTPQPQVATYAIVNVGGIARDRWTCGERHVEAWWDPDARMWRADAWGADGHECTYWAPSSEDATCAAALLLGEVAS